MLEKLLLGLIVFVLPMIPTFAFFGVLKSIASLEGKYKGIPYRVSGAAAGYMIFFAMFHFLEGPHFWPQTARVVHVRGSMKFAKGVPPSAADIKAELHPPDLDVRDGKSFDWPVTIVDGEAAMIVLQPAGFEGQTLFLRGEAPIGAPNYKHHLDKGGNIIYDEPIVFEKVPDAIVQAGPLPSTGGKS